MKKGLTIILQTLIVLIGIAALTFMLWEPHLEGVNVDATPFEIYFKDPFLAFAYIGSISFFLGLYQTYKVLGYAGDHKLFSQDAIKSLRTLKYCAITLIGFVAVGEVFIISSTSDDHAGGVMMGAFIALCSMIVAITAAKFEKNLQNSVNTQTENA